MASYVDPRMMDLVWTERLEYEALLHKRPAHSRQGSPSNTAGKGKEKVAGTTSITAALDKVKIRYPGEQELVSLPHLISQNRLVDLLYTQYPDVKKPRCVQFIPELRGDCTKDRNPGHYFLKKKAHQEAVLQVHESDIVGREHEADVEDAFASLRGSELLKHRALVIMHSIKKEVIWHSKLKKEWNNEFDLVVFDPQYGVFICEIKQKSYQSLKESTTNTYSLAKELAKQKKRYCLFSELRKFYGKDIPIHTILLCNSRQDESRIIEEETVEVNEQEYNFVIDLDLKDFTKLWSNVLGYMKRVAVPTADNIMGFTSLVYAIQSIDTLLPSDIHLKLVSSEFQGQNAGEKGGKRERKKSEAKNPEMSILWSKDQRTIIDYFIRLGFNDPTAAPSLRMCITGCFGSGKTLLLLKFVELFAEKFPDYQILFLVKSDASNHYTTSLLQQSLSRICQHLNNIYFASTAEYSEFNYSTEKQTFRKFSSTQYQLVLIDEYGLQPGWKLDLSHVSDCHLVVVTSYRQTAEGLTGFQLYNLSGSLRSVKDIAEYVSNQQAYQTTTISKPVVVQPLHNLAYKPVKTTQVASGEECIKSCIATLNNIRDNDSNASVMIISTVHRYFLYRLSMQLHEGNIEHYFREHNMGASTSTEQDSTVILCDDGEAEGCECSSVIHVQDEGSVPAEYAGSLHAAHAADSVSRSTTHAVVFVISGTYNEDVLVPVLGAASIAVPCYQQVGTMSSKDFVQYLAGLTPSCNVLAQNTPFPEAMTNKKILVAYSHQVSSVINDIVNMLPAELLNVIVFECYGYTSLYSLDLSKDFILIVQCYSDTYRPLLQHTTLPYRTVELTADVNEVELPNKSHDTTRRGDEDNLNSGDGDTSSLKKGCLACCCLL